MIAANASNELLLLHKLYMCPARGWWRTKPYSVLSYYLFDGWDIVFFFFWWKISAHGLDFIVTYIRGLSYQKLFCK
jgi:hypothetical protein